ncbi:MAG: hypothetical protein IKM79_01200 [Bacteroidales bacterium]|nr:hypothetical protein [Bacteroidales bacterium]
MNGIDKTAVVAEIKRQRKRFNPAELAGSVAIVQKEQAKYNIQQICLSIKA